MSYEPVDDNPRNDAGPAEVDHARRAIELRSDHPAGIDLLHRVVDGLAEASLQAAWRILATSNPTQWSAHACGLALCVDARTRRSPVSMALGVLHLGLYASPEYLQREGTVTLPEWPSARPVLDIDFGATVNSWELASGVARVRLDIPSGTRPTRNVAEASRFARAGLGMAWIPRVLAAPAVRCGALASAMHGVWHRRGPTIHVCLPHHGPPQANTMAVVRQLQSIVRMDGEAGRGSS